MTFRTRPYDPTRPDTRTPAQKAAAIRNFRVFQLRGLHAQVGLLTGKRRERARTLVDQELKAMGALTMADHATARMDRIKAMAARRAKNPPKCPDCGDPVDQCDCIPF